MTSSQSTTEKATELDPLAGGEAMLVVIAGTQVGRRFTLVDRCTRIGREEQCQVRFDDTQLSRRHAELRSLGGGQFELRDLESSNGTFVKGRRLDRPHLLALGDEFRLGNTLLLQLALRDPFEQQLQQRQRLETLGRLTVGIAHDFNNMIDAVVSNIEFLAQQRPETALGDESVAACITDLQAAASRAGDLSAKLLAFSRTRDPDKSATVDVSAVCREVVEILGRTIGRHIELCTDVEDGLLVAAGSVEIYQVLMNLCLNARDALSDGGQVTIRAFLELDELARPPAPRHWVHLSVRDDGPGIPRDVQRFVFEPFYTTKRRGAGFGLGLATVRDIVKGLGGNIRLYSRPDEGTTVMCRFPPAPADATRQQDTGDQQLLAAELDRLTDLTVLLVDDEPMVRRGARRLLSSRGATVIEASDGAEALEQWHHAEPKPHLVLLDVEMPEVDGETALERLLAADPHACVIMLTGHRDAEHEAELRDKGARAVVHKPWRTDELLDAIELARELVASDSSEAGDTEGS